MVALGVSGSLTYLYVALTSTLAIGLTYVSAPAEYVEIEQLPYPEYKPEDKEQYDAALTMVPVAVNIKLNLIQ